MIKASVISMAFAFLVLDEVKSIGPGCFYRLSSQGETVINFGLDGIIHWSNPTAEGPFLIEKRADLSNQEWVTHTDGITNAQESSIKVAHLQPVEGMVFIPEGRFTMGDILGDTRT